MSYPEEGKSFAFHRTGKYRIRVIGSLNGNWSGSLGGLHVTASYIDDRNRPITELVGTVRDQAELSGVMETLYELHMPILLVEYQDESGKVA